MAWSLAETKMRIVCLEQGGWMNPADYPTTRSDWETEGFSGAFSLSPNGRGRREELLAVRFVAAGGSVWSAHVPLSRGEESNRPGGARGVDIEDR